MPGGLELVHHLLEAGGATGRRFLAQLALAIVGDFASPRFGLDHREAVAGIRHAGKAQHLDGGRRAGILDLLALVVDQRTDAGELRSSDDDVADA